jgi:hypothetical protein
MLCMIGYGVDDLMRADVLVVWRVVRISLAGMPSGLRTLLVSKLSRVCIGIHPCVVTDGKYSDV